jgi:hypothetical protein
MQEFLQPSSYPATVEAAHRMANSLRVSRPDLAPQIEELQAIVVRAHRKLYELYPLSECATAPEENTPLGKAEAWKTVPIALLAAEAASALTELEAAYSSLHRLM